MRAYAGASAVTPTAGPGPWIVIGSLATVEPFHDAHNALINEFEPLTVTLPLVCVICCAGLGFDPAQARRYLKPALHGEAANNGHVTSTA